MARSRRRPTELAVNIGETIGRYQVLAKLGEGGMGEVYRARDSKLGREVAVKVLPDAVAGDTDRVARFEREAKALAALNHPHIASLFGLEDSGSRHVLVMELVDGETLADRLANGPIPLAEALLLARQIADALEAAHERDIVHRDLKPANIKVTPEGAVKVLDFGLAKAMDRGLGTSSDLSLSPTLSVHSTQAGLILGTAAYMSPEQAKGLPADHRSDVFSFGCVLYELLTGRQPFPGDSVTDVLASVLAREPEWTTLPATLDPRLTRLLRRCLAKSRRQRWQAMGDVRAEIEFIVAEPAAANPAPIATASPVPPLWKRALPAAAVVVLSSAIAGGLAWSLRPAAAPPQVVRFSVPLSAESALYTNFNRQVLALSADGKSVVFAGDKVYIRPVSEATAQPIPGTEGMTSSTHPAFSPDGRTLVFWAASDRTLKRLTLGSNSITMLCPLAEGGLGLTWQGDNIYFADQGQGVKRVSANGGKVEVVVPLTGREEIYGPQLLPDGDTLIFTLGTRSMPSWDQARIVAQSLSTGQRTVLVENATDGRYVRTGHLLFGRGGVVFAVPFDTTRRAVVGEPIAVLEGVRRAAPGTTGAVHYAVSDNGSLVYLPGLVAAGASLQLALFDRTGAAESLNVPLGPYYNPRVSPDGTMLAVGTDDSKEAAIWIYGFAKSSAARRLTFGGRNTSPVWSADGRRVTFQSTREGDASIWWQRADGTDAATRLTRPEQGASHTPQSWSPDGKHLLFDEARSDRVAIMDWSLADGKATLFSSVESETPSDATFSPDGKWVAYSVRPVANTTQAIVYVEPYPRTGARYQISKVEEDGHHPAWSPDGREIFYTPGPGNRFLAVPITPTPTFAFGDPVLIPRPFVNAPPSAARTYDIVHDGKRFLGLRTDIGSNGLPMAPQIQVVLNWFEELKARVPTK